MDVYGLGDRAKQNRMYRKQQPPERRELMAIAMNRAMRPSGNSAMIRKYTINAITKHKSSVSCRLIVLYICQISGLLLMGDHHVDNYLKRIYK